MGALVKVNYKRLKAILALRIKKLDLFFLASKLGKLPLFDNFFLDLADFWDLDIFLVFNNFLYFSIDSLSLSTPSTSLAASTLSVINTYNDIVVFSIDINGVAILLKP